ncbi:hypothetical protein CXP39_00420 [Mesoplasma syrphidae]|uniref:MFS transporter n=1 Tax=Mesoplasma syrphidae TaxID=225999 RepID=A0A2K9CCA6_9MOLU|nr:MFS transporter [Mesoplasma syrphidae]AUF83274.1 hypothetical protein CXP39_00420 [Mesoplasma syrphidae]
MKTKKIKWSFFEDFKKNFPLLILALADVVVMAIPFYMENYIPNINGNLNLTAAEYSQAGAIYGFVALPCYILGAYIGDKFKSKHLMVLSLALTSILGAWYLMLPIIGAVNPDSNVIKYQLYFIFGGFSFATCGLFWAPLWKVIKNHGTEELLGEEKEKRVGANNGYQGMMNGLIGLTLALFGTLLLTLSTNGLLPNLVIKETEISLGFFILVTIYVLLTVLSLIMIFFVIKEPKIPETSFSVKSLVAVIKQWKIWLLGFLVLGVYMLQMGLSSYINYMNNVFLIPAVAVMIIGIFRTYVMRFLIASPFGKRADKSHSYIFLICVGLLIGIVLVCIAIMLPGFNNDFNKEGAGNFGTGKIIIQFAAGLNLILLGMVTWALVTIRWTPIGAELKVDNKDYAAGVNIISVIAFTPDAFFKQIRSAIESKHNMVLENGTIVANQTGNQLILLVVAVFAVFGLICGTALYILLYKNSDKFIFKKNRNKIAEISK